MYIEKLPDEEHTAFWTELLRLLPDIYARVFRLPMIETRYSSETEKFVTECDYNRTFARLAAFLGNTDKFLDFDDMGRPASTKTVSISLSELLTDIYQELKDFVLLYETEILENMNDSVAECMDTFKRELGIKLLGSSRFIHINLFREQYATSKQVLHPDVESDLEDDETQYDQIDE
jgi:hypothetical protein